MNVSNCSAYELIEESKISDLKQSRIFAPP